MAMITGTAYWAKVVGKPQPGFKKTELEWSMDLAINEETVKQLKEEGLGKKIKTKDDIGTFIQFKRKAIKKDGTASKPIHIIGTKRVDGKFQDWDGGLLGNGTKVNVKYVINEVPYEGVVHRKPGILAIQVVEHVPYEGKNQDDDFPSYDEDGKESWDEE